jgi:hypothetical protein
VFIFIHIYLNIISKIKDSYFGPNRHVPKFTFIPAEPQEIEVEDYITYVSEQEITNYSIIEGKKCVIKNYDLETNEWVFVSTEDNSENETFRFASISHLEVFPLN